MKSPQKQKLLLFLGSGVSLPTRLPGVRELTQELFQSYWYRGSDSAYYKRTESNAACDPRVTRLQKFLDLLRKAQSDYQTQRRGTQANYEDIFYLAQQLRDEVAGNIDNAAIKPFYETVRAEMQSLLKPIGTELDFGFERLVREACNYIQWVVARSLRAKRKPKGLKTIVDLAESEQIEDLAIVTLNHDLLVETVLKGVSRKVVDGFGPEVKGVRYLLSTAPKTKHAIRLCKPHGSINWFQLADRSGVFRFASIDSSPWFCRDEADELLHLVGTPQFLAGSYNKMLEYGYGVFGFMQSWFRSLLEEHDLIVMSGYGWADKGINRSLCEWLLRNGVKRRIILLHEKEKLGELRQASKHGFHWCFDNWVAQGRLVIHGHWLQHTSVETILKLAGKSKEKNSG